MARSATFSARTDAAALPAQAEAETWLHDVGAGSSAARSAPSSGSSTRPASRAPATGGWRSARWHNGRQLL